MNPITDFGSAVEHAVGVSWNCGEMRYVIHAAGQFAEPCLFGDYEVVSPDDLRSLGKERIRILAESCHTDSGSYVGVVTRAGYEHLASLYYHSQHDEVPAAAPRTFKLHEMQLLVLFAENPINRWLATKHPLIALQAVAAHIASDPAIKAAMQLAHDGNKIAAIKAIRDHTGWDLKESKNYVEERLK